MAGIGFTLNYDAKPFKAVGRDFVLINVAKVAVFTQAQLDAIVQAIFTRASITAMGAVTIGTSTSVNFIIEGMDFVDADAYGSTIDYLDLLTTLTTAANGGTAVTVTAVAF
jgi:hypothetical protein